ncbi:MAG: conjugal transfer protein TraF [Candidatus Omnitrophota bacterium]
MRKFIDVRIAGAAAFVLCLMLMVPSQVFALDNFLVGARGAGMAGANVACVNDTTAQYYNPAAFGFMAQQRELDTDPGNFAWDTNVGVGYRIHENLGKLLDDLSKIDITELGANDIQNEADLQNLTKAAEFISRLDDSGNAITFDGNAGTAVRINNFAIGVRGMMQVSVRVSAIDTTNLGLEVNMATLNADIVAVTLTGDDGLTSLFTPAQQAQLLAAGFTAGAGGSIQKLDYAARQAGISTGTAELQQAVDLLGSVAAATTGTTGGIENNTTSATLEGFGMYEIPISYGRALNENISIGGNLKVMKGRVYGTQLVVFKKDSGDIVSEADNNYKETTTFGVDLGAMAKLGKFNLGIVGRNLNSPEFDGPTVGGTVFKDVSLDPAVTAGVAFMPWNGMTLECDYDITKNETALPGYDTKNIAFGAEWMLIRILSLRAGMYKNTEESDIGWVYTAGLGVNMPWVRLELAGAMSADSSDFDGDSIPEETRVTAQLSMAF